MTASGALPAIHVMTVHYRNERWIPIQLRYWRRNLRVPFCRHAFLVNVPARWHAEFDTVRDDDLGRDEPSNHALKLNALAERVCQTAADDDILIFVDGDAFPVRDPLPLLRDKLPAHQLIAVQRTENLGDIQPHPLFCATTARLWRELPGDWRPGPEWLNARGDRVTDVGARLLVVLQERGIEWLPLLRTNRVNSHPVWFGVYGGLICHHGAGFRMPISRSDFDRASEGLDPIGRALLGAWSLKERVWSRNRDEGSPLPKGERWLHRHWRPYAAALRRHRSEDQRLSALLWRLIEQDSDFSTVFEDSRLDMPDC